jgi:transposase
VSQAYRFALDPTPAQEQKLRSHAGAARFAWNWGLDQCRRRYEAEKQWYSAVDLHRIWNQAKRQDPKLAWWKENSKCVYQEAFRNLDRALENFLDSKRGERKGPRLGFPKRKKKGRCRDSFRFSTGVMRCSGTTVTLPRLGTVRTHETTEALARKRPVLPEHQDLLSLWDGESQAVPGRARLQVREMRPGHRPGCERGKEPTRARRQWDGEGKRLWSRGKTRR